MRSVSAAVVQDAVEELEVLVVHLRPLRRQVLGDRLRVRAEHLAVEAVEEDAVARLVGDLGGEEDPLVVGRRGDRERQQLGRHPLLAEEERGEAPLHVAALLVGPDRRSSTPRRRARSRSSPSSSPGSPSARSACGRRAPPRRPCRAAPSPCRCRRRAARRARSVIPLRLAAGRRRRRRSRCRCRSPSQVLLEVRRQLRRRLLPDRLVNVKPVDAAHAHSSWRRAGPSGLGERRLGGADAGEPGGADARESRRRRAGPRR